MNTNPIWFECIKLIDCLLACLLFSGIVFHQCNRHWIGHTNTRRTHFENHSTRATNNADCCVVCRFFINPIIRRLKWAKFVNWPINVLLILPFFLALQIILSLRYKFSNFIFNLSSFCFVVQLSFSPTTPGWSHFRLVALLSTILILSGFMFIVCVGVGFFGGLNTFAFMAAEVSILSSVSFISWVLCAREVAIGISFHANVTINRTNHLLWIDRGTCGYSFELVSAHMDCSQVQAQVADRIVTIAMCFFISSRWKFRFCAVLCTPTKNFS